MLFLTLEATSSNLHFVDMQCVLLVRLVARAFAALRDRVRDLVPLAPVVLPPRPAVMSPGPLGLPGGPPSPAVPPQDVQVFDLALDTTHPLGPGTAPSVGFRTRSAIFLFRGVFILIVVRLI